MEKGADVNKPLQLRKFPQGDWLHIHCPRNWSALTWGMTSWSYWRITRSLWPSWGVSFPGTETSGGPSKGGDSRAWINNYFSAHLADALDAWITFQGWQWNWQRRWVDCAYRRRPNISPWVGFRATSSRLHWLLSQGVCQKVPKSNIDKLYSVVQTHHRSYKSGQDSRVLQETVLLQISTWNRVYLFHIPSLALQQTSAWPSMLISPSFTSPQTWLSTIDWLATFGCLYNVTGISFWSTSLCSGQF